MPLNPANSHGSAGNVNAQETWRAYTAAVGLGGGWFDQNFDGVVAADQNALQVAATGAAAITVTRGAAVFPVTGSTGDSQSFFCYFETDSEIYALFSPPNATLPRKDLVVVQADPDSGDYALAVVTGTPAASPDPPATPDDAFALYVVTVPANNPDAEDWTYTDQRGSEINLTVARNLEAVLAVGNNAGGTEITNLGAPTADSSADTRGARNTAIAAAVIRTAAGVPAGAPSAAANELPFAYDTTAVTGGFYYWNGAAWVKVATII